MYYKLHGDWGHYPHPAYTEVCFQEYEAEQLEVVSVEVLRQEFARDLQMGFVEEVQEKLLYG